MPKSTPRFMERGVDTCRLIDFPVVVSGQLPQPFREWVGEANDQKFFLISVSQMSAGCFWTRTTPFWGWDIFTGVPTSSKRYLWRRHLDSKMAAPKMTSIRTGESFWSPIEAEAQNGGPSASGRHLGWPHFRNRKWGHPRWRPEAEGPPFCASASKGLQKLSLYYSHEVTKGLPENFAGTNFEVFTRFKLNSVRPLSSVKQKIHFAVSRNTDGKARVVGFYLMLYISCVTTKDPGMKIQ